jgi:hypothetical protein
MPMMPPWVEVAMDLRRRGQPTPVFGGILQLYQAKLRGCQGITAM